jgi:hypothetical protein
MLDDLLYLIDQLTSNQGQRKAEERAASAAVNREAPLCREPRSITIREAAFDVMERPIWPPPTTVGFRSDRDRSCTKLGR